MTTELLPLSLLYKRDETAWLEAMAELSASGRISELDHANLSKYLADMANRDRREVFSRLVVLLSHLLKWEHPPGHRSTSWQGTIVEQRRELRKLLESGTLNVHAESVLAEAYEDARKQAAADTSLPRGTFPMECHWDLDGLLTDGDD